MRQKHTNAGPRPQRAVGRAAGLPAPAKGGIAAETPPARAAGAAPSPEERRRRIAELAYRLAEGRGFAPGGDLDDWLKAEAEVDRHAGMAPGR